MDCWMYLACFQDGLPLYYLMTLLPQTTTLSHLLETRFTIYRRDIPVIKSRYILYLLSGYGGNISFGVQGLSCGAGIPTYARPGYSKTGFVLNPTLHRMISRSKLGKAPSYSHIHTERG